MSAMAGSSTAAGTQQGTSQSGGAAGGNPGGGGNSPGGGGGGGNGPGGGGSGGPPPDNNAALAAAILALTQAIQAGNFGQQQQLQLHAPLYDAYDPTRPFDLGSRAGASAYFKASAPLKHTCRCQVERTIPPRHLRHSDWSNERQQPTYHYQLIHGLLRRD